MTLASDIIEFCHGVEVTITVLRTSDRYVGPDFGADGIFTAKTRVMDGAEKVTNEDSHT